MTSLYHHSYAEARRRFRQAAEAAGCELYELPIPLKGPAGEELAIDIAVKGDAQPDRAVVVSSGTHGVEGYFGSAVQISLLEDQVSRFTPADGQAIVFYHAVNTWGMAHKRRVNEDGVDLNRNFLQSHQIYGGAPKGYAELDDLLNPKSPPSVADAFLLKAGYQLARQGFGTLKDAVASGQYDFNKGLFFGGSGPSTSNALLTADVKQRFERSDRVIHIDLHTGMGSWETYCLAVDFPADSDRVRRLKREFGDPVQGLDASGVLYEINGALGPWLQGLLPEVQYDCMLAEFGTWNVIRVIADLRYENRVFHWSQDPVLREGAKARIVETFCPADAGWRRTCLTKGRTLYDQAAKALFRSAQPKSRASRRLSISP
jgi:hypothetical protein